MEFTGKYDPILKEKAVKQATEMLSSLFRGKASELYDYTQLSWRIKRGRLLKRYKKPASLFIPEFDFFEIKQIHFHTPVMIDVYTQLGKLGVYRIRMLAERKAYVTDPESPFRYNPNSLRKLD